MLRKLTFGQYVYKKSLLHELDPRIKIIFVILFSVLSFWLRNSKQILSFSIFIIVLIILSKLNFRYLIENLRPFYFIFIFILLMYILFSRSQIKQGIVTIWRFLVLIMLSLILTYTTTISSLAVAIESLIKPLRIFNIKTRNLAVMISITIRFIPSMFLYFEKTMEAMLARLANFKKLSHIKLLIITLLEKLFKSASNLSDAMQSRLYNENASSCKILILNKKDFIASLIGIVVVLIIY